MNKQITIRNPKARMSRTLLLTIQISCLATFLVSGLFWGVNSYANFPDHYDIVTNTLLVELPIIIILSLVFVISYRHRIGNIIGLFLVIALIAFYIFAAYTTYEFQGFPDGSCVGSSCLGNGPAISIITCFVLVYTFLYHYFFWDEFL